MWGSRLDNIEGHGVKQHMTVYSVATQLKACLQI